MPKQAKSSAAKVRQTCQEYPDEFSATPAGDLRWGRYKRAQSKDAWNLVTTQNVENNVKWGHHKGPFHYDVGSNEYLFSGFARLVIKLTCTAPEAVDLCTWAFKKLKIYKYSFTIFKYIQYFNT